MVLQTKKFVDKYLLVVFIFMIVTIPIAFVNPGTGEIRDPPLFLLFYAAIAGMIIIIFYSSYKARKERQKERAKRRSKK
jgi:NADH:ubiquinone oxidoreductase subunit 3 (subunit A)